MIRPAPNTFLPLIVFAASLALSACAAAPVTVATQPPPSPTSSPTLAPTTIPTSEPSPTPTVTRTAPPPTETPVPSETPWPAHSGSGGGVIAFVSEREGSPGIFLMNADGSEPRMLTNSFDTHPDWSPDGRTLAFSTRRGSIVAIYGYDLEARREYQITDTDRSPSAPDWAPGADELAIIYNPSHPGINYELFLMNPGGSNFKRLTTSAGYQFYANPDWSPDGARIAFAADLDETYNIYLMDPGGENILQLTRNAGDNNKPAWSPDGSRIAFHSDRDGNWEIYVMDSDGGNLQRLTDNEYDDQWPTWSPDGDRIAFQSDRDGNWEIYIMDADGGNPRRLTENEAKDSEPAWSP